MNLWESAVNNANPKYLTTSFKAGRYRLEVMVIAVSFDSLQAKPIDSDSRNAGSSTVP